MFSILDEVMGDTFNWSPQEDALVFHFRTVNISDSNEASWNLCQETDGLYELKDNHVLQNREANDTKHSQEVS